MIWSLVQEQLRAQRRFVVATGVVLALAMAVASYGLFMATTTSAGADRFDATFGHDKEWHLGSYAQIDGEVGDPSWVTLAEQDAALEQAIADGSDVIAERSIVYGAVGLSGHVAAMGGDVDWDAILARGAPPQLGEVALAAVAAEEAGVDVGDTWTLRAPLWCDGDTCEDAMVPLVVSGIARSGFSNLGLEVYAPGAYIAWDDSERVLSALAPPDPVWANGTDTTFNWTIGSPALDALGEAEAYTNTGSLHARTIVGTSLAFLGAMVLGLIAMAFAVGRAQAQARSRWVATARTLGASRRQIAATTILEAGAVGVAAGVVGVMLGYLMATAHVMLLRALVPDPAFPSHVVAPPWAIPALLLLALVLSAIVGAVPAFWAARVQPVAALKPVSDISEAEVSRRVSARPLVVAWLVANVVAIAAVVTGAPGLALALAAFAAVVIVVTTPMLMHEALRWAIPRIGTRLSRSPRRARMIAGDALLARPRQATIPAFIVALGVGTLIAIVVPISAIFSYAGMYLDGQQLQMAWFTSGNTPGWIAAVAIAAVVITTLVTLAIGAATASLTSREAATREALGATRQDGKWAGAIAYGAAQATGIALGLLLGLYVGAWLVPVGLDHATANERVVAASAAVLPVLGVVAIAALGAAAGAAIAASFTPQPMTAARLESVA